MKDHEYGINKLARFLKALKKAPIFTIEQESSLRPKLSNCILTAGRQEISLLELSETVQLLLDERYAAWLLTPEGKQHQVSALKTAMHLGSVNPDFTSTVAQSLAEQQLRPFDATIKILEQNGYVVSKIT